MSYEEDDCGELGYSEEAARWWALSPRGRFAYLHAADFKCKFCEHGGGSEREVANCRQGGCVWNPVRKGLPLPTDEQLLAAWNRFESERARGAPRRTLGH